MQGTMKRSDFEGGGGHDVPYRLALQDSVLVGRLSLPLSLDLFGGFRVKPGEPSHFAWQSRHEFRQVGTCDEPLAYNFGP
jgi:hypothetical protein